MSERSSFELEASFGSMDDVVTPSSFAYSVDTEDSSVDDNEFNRALPNSEV